MDYKTWCINQENDFENYRQSQKSNGRNIISDFMKDNTISINKKGRPAEDIELDYLKALLSSFRQEEIKTSDTTGKALKNFLSKDYSCSFPSSHSPLSKCIWIEIASALQNQSIKTGNVYFKNLSDINRFILSIQNDYDNPSELHNYGVYVRRVTQMCVAYSILRGFNYKKTNSLINEVKEIVNSLKDNHTAFKANQTSELLDVFSCFLEYKDGNDEMMFKERIREYSSYFLSEKELYDDKKNLESNNSIAHNSTISFIEEDIKTFSIDELNENDSNSLYYMLEDIIPDNGFYFSEKTKLKNYILSRMNFIKDENSDLAIVHGIKQTENETHIVKFLDSGKRNMINGYIRCIYLVSLMRTESEYLSKSNNVKTNSIDELNFINDLLNDAHLRTIDFEVQLNKVVINSYDPFDRFITACIISDEKHAGYDAFIRFLSEESRDSEIER